MNDVFESRFMLPIKVCIVGSGPNGADRLHLIPDDCDLLAVNKAVLRIDADYWMAMDITLPEKDWWLDAYADYGMTKAKPVTIFGTMLADKFPADYTFENGRAMNWDNFKPNKNEMRIGTTIAGQALQLCRHLGVKTVYLFGIDMYGNRYYDGTEATAHKDEAWNCINRFSGLIKCFEQEGMEIASLTKTALEVNYVGGH